MSLRIRGNDCTPAHRSAWRRVASRAAPYLLGHEQALRRPIVVVSSNRYNALTTLLVLPLTTRDRGSPLHIAIIPP